MKKMLVLFIVGVLMIGCDNEEIKPFGNLTIKVNLPGISSDTPYALFTEAAYISNTYLPLKQGEVGPNSIVEFNNLLPGTYVFEVYSNNAVRFAGQVLAGESITIEAKLQ